MSSEGFLALLLLLFATGLAVALSHQPRYQRMIRFPKGKLYVLYHVAGWGSLVLAVSLTCWLWLFVADPVAAEVMRLGPAPGSLSFLLPLIFVFLGAAMAFLLPAQLLLCGGVVWPASGHRKKPKPSNDGQDRDAPILVVVVAAVIWIPSIVGYELMRGTWYEIDREGLRYNSFFTVEQVKHSWSEVDRLEYRPWWNRHKGTNLRHGMALVFDDGSEWSLSDDDFWGLDAKPVRDRLRALATAQGVDYRHCEVK